MCVAAHGHVPRILAHQVVDCVRPVQFLLVDLGRKARELEWVGHDQDMLAFDKWPVANSLGQLGRFDAAVHRARHRDLAIQVNGGVEGTFERSNTGEGWC